MLLGMPESWSWSHFSRSLALLVGLVAIVVPTKYLFVLLSAFRPITHPMT